MKTNILFAPDAATASAGAPPAAAPAPSSPPSSTPAVAAPSPAPAPSPGDGGGKDPFADIDAKFKAFDAKNGPPKKDATAPNDKTAKPAIAPAKTADAPEKKVGAPGELNWNSAPKQFRERKEKLEREFADAAKAKTDLELKLKEYETKGKDTEGLLSQIESERKEKEELMSQLRMLKQETTPEFKDKYDKPFDQQAEYAEQVVKGITKADGTPFTWDKDFAALYHMPYAAARAKAIEELGQESAQTVMDEIRDLKKLDFNRQKALQEEKSKWAEKTKQDEANATEKRLRDDKSRKEQNEKTKNAFNKLNEELESSDERYKVAPDDKELSEARKEALDLILASPKDAQQAMVKNAHIMQRAAMFLPNQIKIARLEKQLSDLKSELEGDKPPTGGQKPGGDNNSPKEKSWEDELRDKVGSV